MKKIVYTILILIGTFLLNIGLFFYSESYSFFLKKLKYGDKIIENEAQSITDEYKALSQTEACNCPVIEEKECINQQVGEKQNNDDGTFSGATNLPDNQKLLEQENIKKQIDELFLFFDKKTLEEKTYDQYYQMFSITDEYPNTYRTYHNFNYELYLFPEGKFDEIYDMFELLSKDNSIVNAYTVNKTNNFGKQSFYINLKNSDENVRMIIDTGKILFGLNVKKSYYNTIKPILEKF